MNFVFGMCYFLTRNRSVFLCDLPQVLSGVALPSSPTFQDVGDRSLWVHFGSILILRTRLDITNERPRAVVCVGLK